MPPNENYQFPGPVPQEALDFFERKDLQVGFSWADVWQQEHAHSFTIAKVMELEVLATMRGIVERAIEDGTTFQEFRKDVKPLLDKSGWSQFGGERTEKHRLRVIYDTNMRTARAEGQWERVQRTITVLPYLEYDLGPSVNHREEHMSWAGTVLPANDPWWIDHWPPNGYLCFHESTLISGEITGASKARYSGDMIEFRCSSGARLSVTPNHPIATTRGLVAAGLLRKGDNCFGNSCELELIRSSGFPLSSSWTIGNQEIPSCVNDVFDALRSHGCGTVKVSPLDFHSEAKLFDGEVDVVGSYVQLMDRVQAFVSELACKLPLVFCNSPLPLEFAFCGSNKLGFRFSPAVACSPRVRAIIGNLFRRHFGKPQHRRFGPSSYRYPHLRNDTPNGSACDIFGSRNALNGLSAKISLDEIVSVSRFPFSGHVFDLESESGWLWANSIAVGNCKCHVRQVGEREVEQRGGVSDRPESFDVNWELPDGRTVTAPVGVHPSFHYPPGSRGQALEDALQRSEAKR